jgi:peptidoglycan/LPS O-acetylase OafA/YrhL
LPLRTFTSTFTHDVQKTDPGSDADSRAPRVYPAIDGLRGAAILTVVGYHSGLYENGLFGVDVFFVLSGFLITLTLTRKHRPGAAAELGRFYQRRAKRILLVMYLTLGAVWILGLNLATTTELAQISQQGTSSLFFVANWDQLLQSNAYWSGLDAASPLAQMWSLSITEQFYVVWPPILILALGARAPWRMSAALAIVGIGLVASAVWTSIVFNGSNYDRVYLGTDTHASGLLLGALTALVLVAAKTGATTRVAPGHRATRDRPSAAGRIATVGTTLAGSGALAAIIALSIITPGYRAPWLYPWGLLLVAALTCVVVVAATRPGPLARVLSLGVLVGVGRASYSLFLIHMPVLWLFRRHWPSLDPVGVLVVGGGTSVLLAIVIHHLVSEPLRIRNWRKPSVFTFAAIQVLLVGAFLTLPAAATTVRSAGGLTVLTIGDSLANDFATSLTRQSDEAIGVSDAGLGGCGIMSPQATQTPLMPDLPVPTGCLPWQTRWAQKIAESNPDIIVIDLAWDAVQQKIDGTWADLSETLMQERYRSQLAEMATIVQRAGVPVLIADSRASGPTATPQAAQVHSELIRQYAASHPDTHLLGLNAFLCPDDQCSDSTPSGDPLYVDGVHFSPAGLAYIAPWLTSNILSALGRT